VFWQRIAGEKRVKAGRGFWKTDWFLGVVVVVVVLFVNSSSDLIGSLENKVYDMAVKLSSKAPATNIAIIAIDDESINNIGRWPWSREVHAKMTDLLSAAHAKVVGNSIFYSEPQRDAGLVYIDKLLEIYNHGSAQAADPVFSAIPQVQDFEKFGPILKDAETNLNTDKKLADSIARAGNVVLPMGFVLGDPQGRPDTPVPDYVSKFSLPPVSNRSIQTKAEQHPIPEIGRGAAAIGFLNSTPDADGGVRAEPLTLTYFDREYPSMALMIAARSLNLGVEDIKQVPGESVTLGRLVIKTDDADTMLTHYYSDHEGKQPFQVDSFYDVLTGKIPAEKYAGKIVLIGATAQGIGTSFPTPVSAGMSPVESLAHSVSSILTEQFFVIPWWSRMAALFIVLLVAAYLIVLLPRLRAGMGASLTGGILVALLATHFGLMLGASMWLHLMLPATLLLVGHLALTTKRFLVTEAGKDKSDLESAESNRMLGLAFQGQGQLDMAYEKFRKCPLDDAVMENLYNLALDFERKRQFNKAQSVYEYMSKYNPNFKDLSAKLTRAKTMSETIILGGRSSGTNASLITGDGGAIEKPMLGRYQVDKELGKGAMGVVYLGKDPKIGRVVAIKTMALAQEFEPDELQDVKERFFREAETAGRLNHPNIVTIFDAGEEHDLAYIAMEFLKGKDLVPYTKPDSLLPIEKAVSIHARIAEALAYAHRLNVVHRDVKPANMMYDIDSDTVKVTDFGIARITDSSRTKTGMVLGTPSYMSPEQLSGQKIDGRSDLFSLAVSLYQMSSGRLPFVGDSMAQLMFKIANEEAADVRTINSAIPESLAVIIAKGMHKDINQRYQSGDEMAADLRAVFGAPGATGASTQFRSAPAPAAAPPAPAPAPAASAQPKVDPMAATVVARAPAIHERVDPMAATLVTRPTAPAPRPVPPTPVQKAPPPASDPNIKTVVDPFDPFTQTDVLSDTPEEPKKQGGGDVDFEF
jgi:CHASE2 domain-containing sensor protein